MFSELFPFAFRIHNFSSKQRPHRFPPGVEYSAILSNTQQYSACDNSSSLPSTNRRRRRNIIWFNPPFSKTVRTNVGRNFLQLIDKHFPSTNPHHKVFNRNTVKVSYSCMENIKTIISRHNHRLLKKNPTQKPVPCKCQKPDECPLDGKCNVDNIVYKATVTTTDDGNTKEYIGMTANPFKERYANHKTSFNLYNHSSDTKLSKYVWSLKQSRRNYSIKWSILKRAAAYTPGGKRCGLCLEEKLCILKAKGNNSLNTRSESKDIKRVHSVKNAVFRTSHGFAKLTPFTRHQKQIKYSKKNLICQQPVPSLRFQSKL